MINGPNFRRYVLPFIAFTIVVIASYYLHQQFERAFFTLNIMSIMIVAYFSGTPQAILLTVASSLKIVIFSDVLGMDQLVLTEEIYRFGFYAMAAAMTIYVIHRLKQTASENLLLRKEQEEVLSVVSHDLRNPLSAIRMNVDLLARQLVKEKADDKYLKRTETVIETCNSMNVLIEDLVQLGRIRHKPELKLETIHLTELMDHIRSRLGPLAGEKKLTLNVSVESELMFTADREKLIRVFSNLIGNAIKFTPEGGNITVSSGLKGKTLMFRISDSGVGIAEEELPKIFKRYWQSGLKASKGMGLGLAISQSIVELHGGHISVESEKGKGTTFKISIPFKATQVSKN